MAVARRPVRVAVVVAFGLFTGVVAGCSRSPAVPGTVLTHYPGLPSGAPIRVLRVPPATPPPSADTSAPLPAVRWIDRDTRLAVTIWAGGCPPYPDRVTVLGPHSLRISLQAVPTGQLCTDQLAAVTSELAAPVGLDPTSPAHVLLGDEQLTLTPSQ